jgi:hypothetical protein
MPISTGVISPPPLDKPSDVVKQPEEQEQTHQDEGKDPDSPEGDHRHFQELRGFTLAPLVVKHRRTRNQQDGPVKEVQNPDKTLDA